MARVEMKVKLVGEYQYDRQSRPDCWKYEIRCKSCGKIVGRKQKACKVTKYPQMYQCGFCRGKLEVIAS